MLGQIRLMPNFFILGARRSGTASLAHYLGQHPAIAFTEPRDPYYFQRDDLYAQGIEFYIRSFCRESGTHQWLGEASSSYFAYPQIVGPRLRSLYGDTPLKFIVILREPVSRAWSHYLACVHHGFEKRDFATALAAEAKEPLESESRYFAEGRYASLIQEWQPYYPLDSFLLLLSEDLAANPLAQVLRVFMWLGVDTTIPINVSERLNTARYSRNPWVVEFLNHPPAWVSTITKRFWPESWKRRRIRHRLRERWQTPYTTPPPIDPAIAAELRQRYRSEILALSKLLGRYLSHWLTDTEENGEPTAQVAFK